MASISAAGGSTTTPPTIIQIPMPMPANSITYCTSAAIGVFTAMTEQAKPTMRRPNTANTEPPIEKLRFAAWCAARRGKQR